MTERKLYEKEPPPDLSAKVHPAIWDLVFEDLKFCGKDAELLVQDIKERDAFGERKYGQRLRPFDGRDNLKDAFQEALDLVVYLRKEIYQRDSEKDPSRFPIGLERHYGNALDAAQFLRELIRRRDGR